MRVSILSKLFLTTALVSTAPTIWAQTTPEQDEVIVVGTQIKGASVSEILPVTLLTTEDIEALGVTNSEDLFRAIPSQGATNFNGDNETGGVNGARGDVASINLRSLGTGNTLVLLNGRRLVQHPGTQSENLVPVVSPNLNALPSSGIKRLEVLRDGASAVYGADAVGGVVNTILKDNFDGTQITAKYGSYDGVDADSVSLSGYHGFNLRGGKTNITLFGDYLDRGGILASERPYSANDDKREFVVGTDFEDDSNFNNLSTNSAWGQFDTTRRVRLGGTSLTTSAGRFHIQPATYAGCLYNLNADICIDDSSLDTALRHNTAVYGQPTSDLKRYNAFAFLNHELDSGNEFYGELSFYRADSNKIREANTPLSSTPITISANSYWNPFGSGPNRIAGIDAPIEGLDITIGGADGRYRAIDAGPRLTDVRNTSWRSLAGLRGDWGNWDFDTAILLSSAETNDVTHNRVSSTLFQQALNRTTPDAYNPFNGGSLTDVNGLDGTPNPQSVIDPFLISVRRDGNTSLALADFKISNPALFTWSGGDIGAAFGIEARSERYKDDRDDRLDGSIVFTDAVTGIAYDSDVMGSSATPDTKGDRQTISAFGEFFVPIVSPEKSMPLVHRLEAQVAGRFEHASDYGDVFAPKVALSWYPVEMLQVRSSYSEGFRAPNLEQINAEGVQRSNTRTDYIRCQAQIELGTLANLGACGQAQGVLSVRSGSDELKPETNKTYTIGAVFEPSKFIPGLTLTADYYDITQNDVVGIAGDDLQIVLDFVRRLNGGSNPAVIRSAPDSDDVTFFNTPVSGIEAVGSIISVADPYLNLDRRKSQGIDLGAYLDFDTNKFGDFRFSIDATRLLKFDQDDSSVIQEIRQEAAAADIPLVGSGSLIEQDGFPKWRGVARMNWKYGNLGVGGSLTYTGAFFDPSAIQNTTGDLWRVDEWIIGNAHIDYTFRNLNAAGLNKVRTRIGATNITNEDPPFADETNGYYTEYHNNRGRFIYAEVKADF